MKNIALIGAGQLGSRHLQALASVKQPIKIQVIDPFAESLKVAETRFNEVNKNFHGSVSFHTELSFLEKNIDVAIIATNSKVRRTVIEALIQNSSVKNLVLEKFLFVREPDYAAVGKLLTDNKINAWVNCARRMQDDYQNLQNELTGPIHFTATGNNWGLGCNGIHMLDLFAFITKSNDIVLSNNLIDNKIIESKRSGYIEFTGTISGHTKKDSFNITSFTENASPFLITINTPVARYSIQEGAKPVMRVSRIENDWKWEEKNFNMLIQSQMTNLLVDELLEKGTCRLTSYEESARLHILYLNNLISFLRVLNNNNNIEECLIT